MPDLIINNISTINFSLINIALALSIYVTLSTGLLSLANAGFLAIGAYTAAIVATQTRLSLAVGFILAVLLGALAAWLLGRVVLRLRDLYLAIATLGFGEIVRIIALNGDRIIQLVSGTRQPIVFNGGEGITLPYASPRLVLGLPEPTWPILIYVLVIAYLLGTLHRSHSGRVLAAIRLDESAASTLGIDTVRYKLLAFVLGAAIAAGAGALSTSIIRVIDPGNFTFSRAVDILAYTVLGGMTHWIGPIVGAAVLTVLPEALRFLKGQHDIVNGVIIMLAIIYLPRGLADPRFWTLRWRHRPVSLSASTRMPAGYVGGLAQPRRLTVQQAGYAYGGVRALEDVSFVAAPGTITGLIGPNGAGKTTLLNAISGLTPFLEGQVLLDDQSIGDLPAHQVAKRGIARSFQNIRLFGDLSVLDNVMIAYHLRRRASLLETILRLPRSRREEAASRKDALALLERLGLDHLADLDAENLSYGDQRRVEIARALASRPGVLLLDEPAAGLNHTETIQLGAFLAELRSTGLTMLVVDHDMDLIMNVCDTVVVLNFGKKIADGPPAVIRSHPTVIEAYLGAADVES